MSTLPPLPLTSPLTMLELRALEHLVAQEGATDTALLKALFPPPPFPDHATAAAIEEWRKQDREYSRKAYGGEGVGYHATYSYQRFLATQGLQRRGLIREFNNGFNAYHFEPVMEKVRELRRLQNRRATAPLPARVFCGVYPGGLVFADRNQEKGGDYKRLAFLCYATLKLEVEPDAPRALRTAIENHCTAMNLQPGEHFRISTCGQTIVLGTDVEPPAAPCRAMSV